MLSQRKGISEVVTTVIMIAMVLLASVLVWTIINNLIQGKIKDSASCFGNAEKVTLEKRNICYETDSDGIRAVRFAISLEDVEVDEVLVSISNDAETKSFKIGKEDQTIGELTYLNGASPQPVKLPSKNGGKTYEYSWNYMLDPITGEATNPVSSIKIAPIIGGTQCEISDSSSDIENCLLLA